MKKLLFVFLVLFFFIGNVNAQFEIGKHYIGPSLGVGFGGYGLSFGADYEFGMSLKEIGFDNVPGYVSVGGIVRYYNWSESFTFFNTKYEWSYTDIIIGAQGNYHFKLSNEKFDPWIGLILGFDISSSSWNGPGNLGGNFSSSTGGVFFNGNAGVRYWFSPAIAARISFGFGNIVSSIIFGIDFKI